MEAVLSEHSLHAAAKAGNAECVGALVAKGHGVNAKGGQHDMTPAHLASAGGHGEALELLVAAGADVNAKDRVSRSLWAHAHTQVRAHAQTQAQTTTQTHRLRRRRRHGHRRKHKYAHIQVHPRTQTLCVTRMLTLICVDVHQCTPGKKRKRSKRANVKKEEQGGGQRSASCPGSRTLDLPW